jgi:hypothetical protein
MANLTIAIDDELLRAARIKAVAEGTSVNEICRRAIERYAGVPAGDDTDEVMARFRAIARKVKPSPSGEPIWPGRAALYEEVMRERGLFKDEPAENEAPRR